MKKIVNNYRFLFFIFLASCGDNKQGINQKVITENDKKNSKKDSFTEKKLYNVLTKASIEYDCHVISLQNYPITRSQKEIINYFLTIDKAHYSLDSYFTNQSYPGYSFDLYKNKENNSQNFPFVLFYMEKVRFLYAFFQKDGTSFNVTSFHELYNIESKIIDIEKSPSDTVVVLVSKRINLKIEDFLSKKTQFRSLLFEQSDTNYLLRNGIWVNKSKNNDQTWVMEHFLE